MKKAISLILALSLAWGTFFTGTAFAAQAPSVKSDTPGTMSIEQGKRYTFKFTVSGASSLSVAVGNAAILKSSTKKMGNAYLVTVTGVSAGSAGVYTAVPGKSGIRQCVVTVQPEKIGFGYQNSDYGCTSQQQLDFVRSHADVVGSSQYNKTLSANEASKDRFESFYGVPYSDTWSQITAIRSCISGGYGSGSDGSAYAYYTGSNRMCADCSKALEAALHEVGFNARLAVGTKNGYGHMWCQIKGPDGQWHNLDGKIGTSVNAGYVLMETGYNL